MNTEDPNADPKCRRCNVTMLIGEAIKPAFQTTDGRNFSYAHHQECTPRSRVWKCPKCGHSFTQRASLP